MASSSSFYKRLIKHRIPLRRLIADERLFKEVPEDWHAVVADIQDSTLAVEKGFHNNVNLAATGTIIAVLNDIKKRGSYKIPYFFGGDGATFLIPNLLIEQSMQVLETYR